MNNEWKDFFKENAFLFLIFFVIVFGFVGLTVYNGIRDTRLNNEKYETQLPEEMPLVILSIQLEFIMIMKNCKDYIADFLSLFYF